MIYTGVFLFSLCIEAVIVYEYTITLLTTVSSTKKRVANLFFLYSVLLLISFINNAAINLFSYFIINSIFIVINFKITLFLALFHSAILTAMMGISELAVYGVISRFMPHFISLNGSGLILHTILSKIGFFIIIFTLVFIFKPQKESSNHNNIADFLLLMVPLTSLFIMATFSIIGESTLLNSFSNIMITISSIFLLAVNLLIFGINQYNHKKSQELMEMQLLLQKDSDSLQYYEMLLSQSENQQILIHDIKKHLQSIQLLNQKNCPSKIDEYINQLMQSSDLKGTFRMCDNEMLNAILCRYQKQCETKHIDFYVDIRSGILNNLSEYDLTSLFGNLLDNAVESAELIPNSFIELTVEKKTSTSFLMIVLVNSCHSAQQYNRRGLPISRKKDGQKHGFGMKSVQKIVNQYEGNLRMYYEETDNTFHTIITLKIN